MKDFSGKIAVVTGGGTGMGRVSEDLHRLLGCAVACRSALAGLCDQWWVTC